MYSISTSAGHTVLPMLVEAAPEVESSSLSSSLSLLSPRLSTSKAFFTSAQAMVAHMYNVQARGIMLRNCRSSGTANVASSSVNIATTLRSELTLLSVHVVVVFVRRRAEQSESRMQIPSVDCLTVPYRRASTHHPTKTSEFTADELMYNLHNNSYMHLKANEP